MIANLVNFVFSPLFFIGFKSVGQNDEHVVTRFGKYQRTITAGLNWLSPIADPSDEVFVGYQNLQTPTLKIMDNDGTPLTVNAIVRYRIKNSANFVFNIDRDIHFFPIAVSKTLQHVVPHYTYDELRSNPSDLQNNLHTILQAQVQIGGFEVDNITLSEIKYAPEVVNAMTIRQQANEVAKTRQLLAQTAIDIAQSATAAMAGAKTPEERQLISTSVALMISGSSLTMTKSVDETQSNNNLNNATKPARHHEANM